MGSHSYIVSWCSLFILLAGCITEFHPVVKDTQVSSVVIDGTISEGETIVRISRSVGLDEQLDGSEYINTACVYVECDDGTRSKEGVLNQHGTYHITVDKLLADKKYRLYAQIEENEYISEYLSPLLTPEIDSISWWKNGHGEPVVIGVSATGTDSQSQFYRWTFQEHWEVTAELVAQGRLLFDDHNEVYYVTNALGQPHLAFEEYDHSFLTANNRYYCWGVDTCNSIVVGTSDKLQENAINREKIHEIPASDEKLSRLYYIKVYQSSLRKEAYDYFSTIKKNLEQTGGIFSVMPADIAGNISCINNPEDKPLGYIEVSTTTAKDMFISESRTLYESPATTCGQEISKSYSSGLDVFRILRDNLAQAPSFSFIDARYVNCLLKKNASKNKPYFWPTENL